MEVKNKIPRIKNIKPDIRYLNDMKMVLYDQKWAKTAPNFKVYYVYKRIKEKKALVNNVTVIPPRMLGKEFVKTKGHYHIGNYGEIYRVLKGEGVFLAQKEKNGKVVDVYYIKAKKGDYVIIPPQYAHITINPSLRKEIKTTEWYSKEGKSNYKPLEEKKGACYFYTKSGWIKNKNYKIVPKLGSKRPRKSMPKNLDFLKGK